MNEILSTALAADKNELKKIWQSCFTDKKSFEDWFFEDRFLPEYCTVAKVDGKIVSTLHSLPLHTNIRGRIFPCTVVAGVATLPDHRKNGYMRKVFIYYMNKLRDYRIPLVLYKPVSLETYYFLGHYPISDSQYITHGNNVLPANNSKFVNLKISENYSSLYLCYSKFAKKYSCMIQRSYTDFVLKCCDYLSYDAKCIAIIKDGNVEGYCIYFDTEKSIQGEEFAALSDTAYKEIYCGLTSLAKDKELTIRLASDVNIPDTKSEKLPKSVIGVSDVSELLKAINISDYAIQVTDKIIEANSGVYNLCGKQVDKAPQIKIDAGRLAQWVTGYISLSELSDAGYVDIFDKTAFTEMDIAVPKCLCYIIDEY